MSPRSVALALSILLAALPHGVRGQFGLLPTGEGPSLHLELMKPFFDTGPFGDGFGFTTGILDATVVVPLGAGPALFGRLGLAHATIDGNPSSSTLSNPRLGVLVGGERTTHGEVHVDLPMAKEFGDDDYATGVAVFTDFERLERFAPDTWSVGGSITRESVTTSALRFGARLGGTVWIPSETGTDSEVLATYAAFLRFPAGSTRLGAELSGIVVVSESDLSFGERNTSSLTLSVALPEAGAAPEAYARIPIDDELSEFLDLVLGVRVRFGG